MSTREILVARHGETQWNRLRKWQGSSDIPLNEKGLLQARQLGISLTGEGIGKIYSSDLQRSFTTAKIVSEIVQTGNVTTDSRLRERGLGKFEGWKSVEVARFLGMPDEQARILETDELSIENGPEVEPWESFTRRVWSFLEDAAVATEHGKILVVAHGGVMRAISYTLTQEGFGMPEYSNGQYIRLKVNENNWQID